MEWIGLVGGLVLLLAGGDLFVRGAGGLARSFGVSPLVVGLTVVAFGTSAPELVVNVLSAVRGSSGIAFGNVVGSNLANIGLILGLTALLRPLTIESRIISREIPILIFASLLVGVLAIDTELRGLPRSLDRTDGITLLMVFAVFLYATIGGVLIGRKQDALVEQAEDFSAPGLRTRGGMSVVIAVAGLAALVAGGEVTVRSASEIARALGITEAVIGLVVIGVGTSLPELVTSLLAVRRRETDIAVGNIVGSNIFNSLFILGTTATVAPIEVPDAGRIDLLVVALASLVLLQFSASGRRTLGRGEGLALLAAYLGYTMWRLLSGGVA